MNQSEESSAHGESGMAATARVWKLTVRGLRYARENSTTFLAVINTENKKVAANTVRRHKFTEEWWSEHLLIDLEDLGSIWYIEARGKA